MKKIIQAIPFHLKIKLRSLGWRRINYSHLKHLIHYLNINFSKRDSSKKFISPNDELLAKQLSYELTNYSPYRHQEFVIEIQEPVIIEPLMGGVIARGNTIIDDCYALPEGNEVPLPYLPIAIYKMNQSTLNFQEAISLRHPWGDNNYFHFYNDILPKLGLLLDLNLLFNRPIIVSKNLYNTSYFQSAIQQAKLKDLHWIVQDKEYIRINNLITIRAHELTPKGIERNLKLLNITEIDKRQNRKIFLMRTSSNQRNMTNREEVVKICLELGFECIDCSKISLQEQIEIFANARYIVGEHGAAFANIIYRNSGCLDILEIFPPHHISTCYFVISQCLGFNHYVYRCQIGSRDSYTLEPIKFERMLQQILLSN
ncbi:glycosyltransferase family 61 protein [Pseudanabaena sp. UWO310]|uniref:glycosyltransferase family 61 protein n=1 Tax=Pseudanabaena sp. UWO310 TaxID=2480795 RepID=UPI001160E759|nr:glycosyltransferase family 61 protein [Pseudanabaena sp. UWO310]TYQ24017.1 glycosyltransferase family 61 protein [Pseudanabaena sp. UWO310]